MGINFRSVVKMISMEFFVDLLYENPISNFVSEEETLFLESYLGEHYKHLYYWENTFPNYFYFNKFTYVPIWKLDKESLDLMRINELIEQTDSRMNNWIQKNDFHSIFSYVEKKMKIPLYVKHFDEIPFDQKYDVFRQIYRNSEYGFHDFDPELLEQIFDSRSLSKEWEQDMQELRSLADKDGFITIYRGEGERSQPIEEALSWSLSKDMAIFFATRFAPTGILYEGKIEVDDVLDYMHNRDEEEVLVEPSAVKDIHKEIVGKAGDVRKKAYKRKIGEAE